MLVCQCNIISDREIRQIVRDLLREDPWAIIVPAKVYRALEKRCKCAGCVPNVVDIISEVTQEYHREMSELPAPAVQPRRMPLAARRVRKGVRYERRIAGHRSAQ